MRDNFIVYAHRGASEYAPENTLMSFYLGVQMGANGIETDVRQTKDGVLVLFHDETLDRVTDGTGNICDYTFEELQKFNVIKNGKIDKIVTLEEFLSRFAWRDLTFAIEIKAEGVSERVYQMIKKYNAVDKCIITSFEFENFIPLNKYAPELKMGYLVDDITEDVLNAYKQVNFYEICPNAYKIDGNFVKKWNEMGYNVRAWNITNQEIMKKAYNDGVGGMTVNFPDKLIEYIK